MKIFHFSDSHLWCTFENTSREEDFYENFIRSIEAILTQKPDVVVHTGDLFHSPKPSNRAISVVVEQFLRLEKAGIPLIIIAGNHDSPRLSTTTHPFTIFESMDNISAIYEPNITSLEVKNINFVMLPHIHDEALFGENFAKAPELQEKNMPNIFLSHFGISAKEYDEYTDEISGINITTSQLKILKSFDYVALGHYHKQFCIGKICYPGSGEHTSFKQKTYKIGYNIFDTDSGKITHCELPTRVMLDIFFDAKDVNSTDDILEKIAQKYEKTEFAWAMVKITLKNVGKELLLEFDEKKFLEYFEDAFYTEIRKIPAQNLSEIGWQTYQASANFSQNFDIFFEDYQKTADIKDADVLKKSVQALLSDI